MELKKVLSGIDDLKAKGNLDIDINKIEKDSKLISKGDLFVAIKGFEVDGHEYIETAIENGAAAILVQSDASLAKVNVPQDITIIVTDNTRKAMSIAACNINGNPTRKFKLVGVTGTKGKTTTTFMMKSILEKAGQKVGIIGSVATYVGNEIIVENDRTTPDSIELQKIFAKMADMNVDVVVMEVSSQSLKLDRVTGSQFDTVVFTNFSKDHISDKEHATMEEYFEEKIKLFEMCNTGIINGDDFHCLKVKKRFPESNIMTYGIDNATDFLAKDVTVKSTGVDYKIKLWERHEIVNVSIPGRFSVYNSLAAVSVAKKLGANMDNIKEGLVNISVPGRSELVENSKGLSIMIDYAHSPESLESILKALKGYVKGSVISVFGCGGNRDNSKRPLMGEISGQLAGYTIITSDNSRFEKPEEIIAEIEAGMKKTNGKYECVIDRKEAIKKAIKMATKNDVILLAGKGHETYQEVNGEKTEFDERKIVKEILKGK